MKKNIFKLSFYIIPFMLLLSIIFFQIKNHVGPGTHLFAKDKKNHIQPKKVYPVDLTQSSTSVHLINQLAQKRTYWPTKQWQEKPIHAVNIDKKKFNQFIKYTFPKQSLKAKTERKGIRTNGLVIIKDGYLVFEKYSQPYKKSKPHLVWSVSKSITNALIGIAQFEKKVNINEAAYKYCPPLDREGGFRNITIHHLLQMSSGLYWNEGYESSPLKSSVIAMLYTQGRNNMAKFAASQPLIHKPGTFWYYSSGSTNILMAILKKALGETSQYKQYPWVRLFNPLGMKNVVFEADGAGQFVGSSYVYMRPRDLAKFGFLYLNNGRWENKQILPPQWVSYTTTMAKAYKQSVSDPKDYAYNYGAQWYINQGIPSRNIEQPWPDAPKDTFHASGHWGQFLFVIPSLDMVIARVGDDRDNSFDKNKFLKLLLASIEH